MLPLVEALPSVAAQMAGELEAFRRKIVELETQL
jgi:hypothetical protein